VTGGVKKRSKKKKEGKEEKKRRFKVPRKIGNSTRSPDKQES